VEFGCSFLFVSTHNLSNSSKKILLITSLILITESLPNVRPKYFEAIYAIHTIPTLAIRVNGLCYSGDMRYDENWFDQLVVDGVLSQHRRDELIRFGEGALEAAY